MISHQNACCSQAAVQEVARVMADGLVGELGAAAVPLAKVHRLSMHKSGLDVLHELLMKLPEFVQVSLLAFACNADVHPARHCQVPAAELALCHDVYCCTLFA